MLAASRLGPGSHNDLHTLPSALTPPHNEAGPRFSNLHLHMRSHHFHPHPTIIAIAGRNSSRIEEPSSRILAGGSLGLHKAQGQGWGI